MENLSFIIGEMYDASLDPAIWEAVLAKIALFLGAVKTGSIVERSTAHTASPIFAVDEEAKTPQAADAEAQKRLALIAPHVARATAIGQALERARLEARVSAEVLDHVQTAILVLDGGGRVVQTNLSARQHLANGSVLRIAQGVLRMHDPEATEVLDRAVASVGKRETSSQTAPVTIALRSVAGERYFASVQALTSGMQPEIGDHRHAVAAVFIRRIGLDLPIDPTPLRRAYELTPRELTVVIAVVESGGVPEAMAILGLSENTIRTHLQSIYRKTGARNQSELARLAASAGAGWH